MSIEPVTPKIFQTQEQSSPIAAPDAEAPLDGAAVWTCLKPFLGLKKGPLLLL